MAESVQHQLNQDIRTAIREIFTKQSEDSVDDWLQNIGFDPLNPVNQLSACCKEVFEKLREGNAIIICQDTWNDFVEWSKERKYRITGSRYYEIFTYTNNKNPDWSKKSSKYFSPKNFTSEYTDHGIACESAARKKFQDTVTEGEIVYTTGLIVSVKNPWLGYSPDGVIFQNGKPVSVLEIKCPCAGKQMRIQEAMMDKSFNNCLIFKNGIPELKKNINIMLKYN